jgi:hypothetical protein
MTGSYLSKDICSWKRDLASLSNSCGKGNAKSEKTPVITGFEGSQIGTKLMESIMPKIFLQASCARIIVPRFRENKLKTLVFSH